ncbi:MAG: hypothetical protein ABH804_01590 [archaeon]
MTKQKFQKVTPELIKRCTDDLEFYDKHGHFPYKKGKAKKCPKCKDEKKI